MATTSREKLFWLGCGVFIIAAVRGISWQVQEGARLGGIAAVEAQEMDEEKSIGKGRDKKPGTESDISLETLAVLIDHPNYDIRHAARKIVLNRFANNSECCMRLSHDYFNPEKKAEASAVLNELSYVADEDSLIRTSGAGGSDGPHVTIDRTLQAVASGTSGPVVTLEEVGGENGEVVSLRLEGTGEGAGGDIFVRSVLQEREESPEELALRRWRRREAMVVEVDADEGVAELVLPS